MTTLTQGSPNLIATGTSAEAQAWVRTSTLSDAAKTNLIQFISYFPQLVFYRENPQGPAHAEEAGSEATPGWLQNTRRTLAYVMPEDFVSARFDNLEDAEENWFTIYTGRYLKDVAYLDLESQLHASGLALQLIGERVDMPGTVLAVNDADPNEHAIYEFNLESLWDFKRNGFPLSDVIYKVFDSYPEMLAHIKAFRIGERGQEILVERIP